MQRATITVICECLALSLVPLNVAPASISWSVSFDDPGGSYSTYYDEITSHVIAAGSEWASYLDPFLTASLEVIVNFDPNLETAGGTSTTIRFVENNGLYDIWQWGATAEIIDGLDPNGTEPDILISLGTDFLMNTMWFDADPLNRVGSVPLNKTEAYSVFTHELAHSFAFNGWRDDFHGTLPGAYASPFDVLTNFDGTNFFFTGPTAVDIYGDLVPLTYGNYRHVGNSIPRPGDDLLSDLMNGVLRSPGTRYSISPLDLAIAVDAGLPVVRIPIPGDDNRDNSVDAADYVVWRKLDRTPEGYNAWLANFGRTVFHTVASQPEAPVVPEPSPRILLAWVALAIMLVRCAVPSAAA